MNEFMFGLSKTAVSRQEANRRESIAKRHGCWFTEVNVTNGDTPGINNGRYQSWFSGPNQGWPFDRDLANAVQADLDVEAMA